MFDIALTRRARSALGIADDARQDVGVIVVRVKSILV
jgi:hypothetical protein